MTKATNIAEIVIAKFHEKGDAITQLKLQKLLYYIKGWGLVLSGQKAFEEPLEAWDFGPVVYSVRQKFADFGRGPLKLDHEIFPGDDALIDSILDVYGQHNAESLVALTHKDMPWQKNYIPFVERTQIPDDDLVEYFRDKAANSIAIHREFLDDYRAKKHNTVSWIPPGELSETEIASLEACLEH